MDKSKNLPSSWTSTECHMDCMWAWDLSKCVQTFSCLGRHITLFGNAPFWMYQTTQGTL